MCFKRTAFPLSMTTLRKMSNELNMNINKWWSCCALELVGLGYCTNYNQGWCCAVVPWSSCDRCGDWVDYDWWSSVWARSNSSITSNLGLSVPTSGHCDIKLAPWHWHTGKLRQSCESAHCSLRICAALVIYVVFLGSTCSAPTHWQVEVCCSGVTDRVAHAHSQPQTWYAP